MTVLTDTQVVTASGGLVELGYSQITSGVSVISTTPSVGTTVIAPLTVVCDGSPVMVEFFAPLAHPNVTASDAMSFRLAMDGASVHESWGYQTTPASGPNAQPVHLSYRATPSAGSHTFSVTSSVTNAARPGTISASATSTNVAPAFLRVSKIVTATQWPAVTTGTIICTSSTRPASPFAGQQIYETDTSRNYQWNGTAWVSPQTLSIPTMCRARSTTATSIANGTPTTIPLAATDSYDTAAMHDTATNNTRVITRAVGVFSVVGTLYYAGGGAGSYRLALLFKNGVEFCSVAFPISAPRCNISIMDYASSATDYYELGAYQDSGGAMLLSSMGSNPETASLAVTYVGPIA